MESIFFTLKNTMVMKKNYIFLTFVFIFACVLNMQAQSFETDITKVLSQDETVLSFNKNEARNISGILASGNIKFTSSNGYVRILVADQYGYEKLVYESFPLLAFKEGKDSFELMGFETGEIKDFVPEKIHILISDAIVEHLKITVSGISVPQQAPAASLQARTRTVPLPPTFIDEDTRIKFLIYRLNLKLEASGALWRAGDTPFGRLSYEEKKAMYGGVVPNFKGAEYYIGGILDIDAPNVNSKKSSYVPDFDWRTRHSATVKGSPYFQNEITGWITPVKDQKSCGSCWAFSAIGAMEAVAKLYKNADCNFDLSEQELVSCSNAGSCNGGWPSSALDYTSRKWIQDEMSFRYKAQDRPCSEKGKPLYTIKNAGKELFSPIKGNDFASIEKLKSMLIKSPLAGCISSWSHAMTLVGYKTIKAGDIVYEHYNTRIVIKPGDPHIGQTVWIFKNSWGENWGDHGFLYAFVNINNMASSAAPTLPFEYKYNYDWPSYLPIYSQLISAISKPTPAYDKDNDGYYWWGIGPRPKNLPASAKLEEDSDDSDASIGPMNQYGFPTLLKDYDLYIKDNTEDMGFEPNTTIKEKNFWSAPQVWVRHQKDGIEEHQNPLGGKDNYIYVRVWNRGQKKSPESRVSAFWAKAGTNLQWPEAWTGQMMIENIPVGGTVPSLGIVPPLEPGQSAKVVIKWPTPNPEDFSIITNEAVGGRNLWHFCLLLMISDRNDSLTYPKLPDIYRHVTYNNNVVQKNVTIVNIGTGSSYEGAVSVINHLKTKEAYSLDVIELPNAINGSSNTLFDNARVQLRMAPKILAAWNEGGNKGVKIKSTGNPYIQELISSNGSLDSIKLAPRDIDLVKLSVNFKTVLPFGSSPEKYTILLRQKDKNGEVVGGETFEIIREPRLVIHPQIIKNENEGKVKLSVTGVDEEATYQWFDSNGKMIAEGAEMTCAPTRDETYRVEVTAKKDGYLTSSELFVKAGKGKMKVSPIPVKSELTVSYDLPNGQYELCITGAQNWLNYGKYSIDSTKKEVRINVSHLPQGIYIATITERNGQIKESVKFVKE
ncbi:papain family cysteine protease [Porphyromonas endodontalis ATCC 35406]|uniref:Papain family cysteine protease n=2 Tax=Porphyromonas endodontalis TaxID=28124 RepID=C3J932_POREA|nr:papain family cysteine protease [Porphyromonas endodontalis ATCC 35406]